MGTVLRIAVEAEDRGTALQASEAAYRAVVAVEARLSTWRPDSELALLNQAAAGAPRELSPELVEDLAAALHWWQATQGAFDPGLGALVAAWGLREDGRVPERQALVRAREASGARHLDLDGTLATRGHPEFRIEEGGFGKGRGLDAALEAASAFPVRSLSLDFGGQLAVLGGDPSAFAVAHPDRRETEALRFQLGSGSVATSGTSERSWELQGRRVHHLLDPRTGEPAQDFGSLTVWAASATAADCLATGLYALGPRAALRWAAQHPGIELLVLERQGGDRLLATATPRFADRITALHPGVGLRVWSGDPHDRLTVPSRP